ncbi:hypothetical protein [Kineococcus gypseus]|uniref:hypothetical protein n=1 Tax=Kineococcus gypseus TaxID=1637102 RepID=UPI003D7DAD71
MRYAVSTGELTAVAGRLREGACLAGEQRAFLDAQAGAVDAWCCGRAAVAAHAFLATLAQAARDAAAGLEHLGARAERAAGAYDDAEMSATPAG